MNSSSVFQFRITLKRNKPNTYRDIQVPMDMDFYAFHVAIQDAMGWDDCHLYEFRQFSCRPDVRYSIGSQLGDFGLDDMETKSARSVLVGDYFKSPKDKAIYLYDFGDSWEHEVKLMKLVTKDLRLKYPRCVGGKGVCPPEDSGGPGRHSYIIANPQCAEYKEYMSWLSDIEYDVTVTKFDHKKVVMTDAEERWKDSQPPTKRPKYDKPETETEKD